MPDDIPQCSAMTGAPRRQARWVLGGLAAGLGAWACSLPILEPRYLFVTLVVAAMAAAPSLREVGVAGWCVLCGMGCAALVDQSIVLGAVAGAGASVGLRAPFSTGARDTLHGGLTALGATLVSSLLASLIPAMPTSAVLSGDLDTVLVILMVVVPTSFAVWAPAWRHDHPEAPGAWSRRRLLPDYRSDAHRSAVLYAEAAPLSPDVPTRRGLLEVTEWVHRLQHFRQDLHSELKRRANPPADMETFATDDPHDPKRVPHAAHDTYPHGQPVVDAFTRDRQRATQAHIQRLHRHTALMQREAHHAEALVDYALAFLEEARAGLVLRQLRPGIETPHQLGEVLRRLRSHHVERDAQARTERELATAPGNAVRP
jgi:hypothetical protein